MQFKANLFLTVLAILVLALLVNLGYWQLNRAQEKQDILDLQSSRMDLKPVGLLGLELADKNLRYLPISVSGQIDMNRQILIDNQVRHGRAGYFVLAPIVLTSGEAILVNRGWVPLGFDRSVLPDIAAASKFVSMVGKLDHFPSVGIKLDGADELSAGWPAVTQVVDVKKVSHRLGYNVLPYQVLLNGDEPDGYDREWVPMKMGPEKHHGYAFQWFALATAWVVIYFVLTIKVGIKRE
ncbi:MAG: cytochrome oxidase biosynthesis protein [Cycloclasticus sp. symbiont of Bathymodiolus heckerae]|nr:MAG: cytochrome oxidase biosynthesis protein [Cycloclasticus sp. symbiont of Bathymodiolus heckerae]